MLLYYDFDVIIFFSMTMFFVTISAEFSSFFELSLSYCRVVFAKNFSFYVILSCEEV